MKHFITITLTGLLFTLTSKADVSDLLITEIAVTPTQGEFIEIYNNGTDPVDLTNVYITDATFSPNGVFYYNIVIGGGGGGGFADFHARFPNGAMIAAGEYQTIALNGSADFINTYATNPTYKISDDGVADGIAPLLEARTGSVDGNSSGLSGGEVLILYSWDGSSDLVQDLDYIVWGDKNEAVDKSGIAIDSNTDADSDTSTYLSDTSIAAQTVISTGSHSGGNSWQRGDLSEGVETQTGGNGINGSDETSEDLNNTFFEGTPTPNAAGTPPPPPTPVIVINEVDAVGSAEFIELFSASGNASLNDVTLVFYQGSDDTIYNIIDLSGNNTNANGYFLIGDASLNPDITLPANSLNDDANAVAIYFSNVSNFNIGDAVTATDIIDALVYSSGQADDDGLLSVLNTAGGQINEDGNANSATESNSRCLNGSGGALNTSTFKQTPPTAGTANDQCPIPSVDEYYDGVDTTNASTLRMTLHDIIKVAESFDYTTGGNINDTWDILSQADEDPLTDIDPNVVENMIMIYKNESLPYFGGGQQAYNREHTWPQSRGFSSGSMGSNNAARTDAHHLMMSDAGYNSDRGNKYYDNCNASCTEAPTDAYNGIGGGTGVYPGNSNWYNGTIYEVWNARKGDVARAMFYLDVRYEGDQIDPDSSPLQNEPDLVLVEDPDAVGGASMGRLSTLLQWHLDDPVDQTEMMRNNVVFGFQQNRNPFVDHPEWVACIFQDVCIDPNDIIFSSGFESP